MLTLQQSTFTIVPVGPRLDNTGTANASLPTNVTAWIRQPGATSWLSTAISGTNCVGDTNTGMLALGIVATNIATTGSGWHLIIPSSTNGLFDNVLADVVPTAAYNFKFNSGTANANITQCGGSNVPAGAIPNAATGVAGGLPILGANTGAMSISGAGYGLSLNCTSGGGPGLNLLGSGVGAGLQAQGGANGPGIYAAGSGTNSDILLPGHGLNCTVSANLTFIGGTAVTTDTNNLLVVTPASNTAGNFLDVTNSLSTSVTLREGLRAIAAGSAGKSTNNGNTFRDIGDTKNVMAATIDASSNRSAINYDLT